MALLKPIEFKVKSNLLASVPLPDPNGDLHLILVEFGDEWVVSQYISGSTEWIQGHYFSDEAQATGYFLLEAISRVRNVETIVSPRFDRWVVANKEHFLNVITSKGV